MIIFGIMPFLCSYPSIAATQVLVFTPYDFEPFVIDREKQTGLVYDFQRELNARGRGIYEFSVQTAPRIPAERLLKLKEPAIVPFVAKDWFDDTNMDNFDWTQSLMQDANVLISHRSDPLDSLDPAKVRGRITVGSAGLRRDKEVEKLIQDKVVRYSQSPTFGHALLMVARKRADFYVAGQFMVQYLIRKLGIEDQIHIKPEALRIFSRCILVTPKGFPGLLGWLNQQLDAMAKSSSWHKTLDQYRSNPSAR